VRQSHSRFRRDSSSLRTRARCSASLRRPRTARRAGKVSARAGEERDSVRRRPCRACLPRAARNGNGARARRCPRAPDNRRVLGWPPVRRGSIPACCARPSAVWRRAGWRHGEEHPRRPNDPFSRGHICRSGGDRRRAGGSRPHPRAAAARRRRWRSVSWKEALDEAGKRLAAIQRKHGRSAVGLYIGNPSVHSYSAMLGVPFSPRARIARFAFPPPGRPASSPCSPRWRCSVTSSSCRCPTSTGPALLMLGRQPARIERQPDDHSIRTARRAARARRQAGGGSIPAATETAADADQHLAIRAAPTRCSCWRCCRSSSRKGGADLRRLAAFSTACRSCARRRRDFRRSGSPSAPESPRPHP